MTLYDVVVIGAGPGGYVAAIRASQLGFKVACIEKDKTLGGTCLNVGCIPSKALLQSTEHFAWLKEDAKEHGIEIDSLKMNFSKMMERKAGVVKGLVEGIAALFKRHKIDWIQGTAKFVSPHKLDVLGKSVEGESIIIATGSEPIPLSFLPFDEKRIVSSTGALSLAAVPEKFVCIGAGVIGVEIASIFARLGSQVTVIEMLDHICPACDPLIQRSLLTALKKQGIEFHLSSKIESASIELNEIQLKTPERLFTADVVLVAIGRRALTKDLNLEALGISLDSRGCIPVDGRFRTKIPHIYAIGDCIEGPMLAHKASDEGIACAEVIANHPTKINYLSIPNVVYTDPEAASTGLTEPEAKKLGLTCFTGTSYFKGNPRARCSGHLEGVCKVIGDQKTGKLIGLHILGHGASEMIGEGVFAIEQGVLVAELARLSHAHPTFSEAIKEAAEQALGFAIHA